MTADDISNLMKRLPTEVYRHSLRVCKLIDYYVSENNSDYSTIQDVALLHDILEDTYTTEDELSDSIVREAVLLLTRKDGEIYFDYINRIVISNNRIAFVVKIADLSDHLLQSKTLSPSLTSILFICAYLKTTPSFSISTLFP